MRQTAVLSDNRKPKPQDLKKYNAEIDRRLKELQAYKGER